MDSQDIHKEFKLANDKSLLVATFLAVIMFLVLFTVVKVVNRGEQYTQTESKAQETIINEETANDISDLESEINTIQQEWQLESESDVEPNLDINLDLDE